MFSPAPRTTKRVREETEQPKGKGKGKDKSDDEVPNKKKKSKKVSFSDIVITIFFEKEENESDEEFFDPYGDWTQPDLSEPDAPDDIGIVNEGVDNLMHFFTHAGNVKTSVDSQCVVNAGPVVEDVNVDVDFDDFAIFDFL